MRALVTGSTGFLGSHLADHLSASMDVVPFKGDIRQEAAWAALPPVDIAFHLAALSNVPASLQDPVATWQVNAEGTMRLLEWARARDVQRVVLVSSAHVYGRAQYSPIDEKHPTVPISPYGASKLAAEAMATAYHRSYGLPVVIVRPFNIYGPRQGRGFLVPDILLPMAQGSAPTLGNPHPVRDFTYVDDAVRFLHKAGTVEGAVGMALNLGSGEGHSVKQVADMALEVSGTPFTPTFDVSKARAVETDRLVVDNRLAAAVLDWKPEVGLRDGLRRTWDAMRTGARA